jgi:hypothetical protein
MVWLSVAKCSRNLTASRTPDKTGDLSTHGYGRQSCPRGGVEEVDHFIVGSSTSGKQVRTPGAEGYGFDGSKVMPCLNGC